MRIAFHAPLKPPDHPHPSGDRTMARLLMQALRAGGHEVFLASRLRTREPDGDREAQQRLRAAAQQEIAMLSARFTDDPPDLWFTYHLYYKAPDLIGPRIADTFGIPYVAAEASHAAKRMQGPHAGFASDALGAIRRADAIFCMTARDSLALSEVTQPERLHRLRPFMNVRPYRPAAHGRRPLRLLAVGMMRPGDKLDSFLLLARALGLIQGAAWTLTIVGDGEAARQVRAAFAPLGGRVHFTGLLPAEQLDGVYRSHDLYVWPAVNEAYGLSLLQASAHGLPVVAGDEGGVDEIVAHGRNGLLTPPRDPHALAHAIRRLIIDRHLFERLSAGGWRRVERFHRLATASRTMNRVLAAL